MLNQHENTNTQLIEEIESNDAESTEIIEEDIINVSIPKKYINNSKIIDDTDYLGWFKENNDLLRGKYLSLRDITLNRIKILEILTTNEEEISEKVILYLNLGLNPYLDFDNYYISEINKSDLKTPIIVLKPYKIGERKAIDTIAVGDYTIAVGDVQSYGEEKEYIKEENPEEKDKKSLADIIADRKKEKEEWKKRQLILKQMGIEEKSWIIDLRKVTGKILPKNENYFNTWINQKITKIETTKYNMTTIQKIKEFCWCPRTRQLRPNFRHRYTRDMTNIDGPHIPIPQTKPELPGDCKWFINKEKNYELLIHYDEDAISMKEEEDFNECKDRLLNKLKILSLTTLCTDTDNNEVTLNDTINMVTNWFSDAETWMEGCEESGLTELEQKRTELRREWDKECYSKYDKIIKEGEREREEERTSFMTTLRRVTLFDELEHVYNIISRNCNLYKYLFCEGINTKTGNILSSRNIQNTIGWRGESKMTLMLAKYVSMVQKYLETGNDLKLRRYLHNEEFFNRAYIDETLYQELNNESIFKLLEDGLENYNKEVINNDDFELEMPDIYTLLGFHIFPTEFKRELWKGEDNWDANDDNNYKFILTAMDFLEGFGWYYIYGLCCFFAQIIGPSYYIYNYYLIENNDYCPNVSNKINKLFALAYYLVLYARMNSFWSTLMNTTYIYGQTTILSSDNYIRATIAINAMCLWIIPVFTYTLFIELSSITDLILNCLTGEFLINIDNLIVEFIGDPALIKAMSKDLMTLAFIENGYPKRNVMRPPSLDVWLLNVAQITQMFFTLIITIFVYRCI